MPPYEKPKTSYDFITKPPTQQKKPLIGSSKIAAIAGGGVGLVIVLFVLLSVFTGGSDNETRLISITQQQTEIARVATLGTLNSEQTTKNIALNTAMSANSDRQKIVAVLAENGIKVKPKQMAATQNPKTDQTLAAAKSAANFDDTFTQTLDEQLAEYQATLKDAYDASKNKKVQTVLSDSYDHARLLRTQIEQNKR
jgi:hypothetical protein